jgi:outer membrane receptor protein involved in Fe transport
MTQFLSDFKDNRYYMGVYTYGPVPSSARYLPRCKAGNQSGPPEQPPECFNIGERIWAGYAMNTISLGKLRLQTGIRIESTQDTLLANKLDTTTDPISATPIHQNNSYTNVFPSVQAQYRLGTDTILRGSYGMGIARPNFGDIAPYFVDDPTSIPEFSQGNPNLKPTHAQNFDVLAELASRWDDSGRLLLTRRSLTRFTVIVNSNTLQTLTNGPVRTSWASRRHGNSASFLPVPERYWECAPTTAPPPRRRSPWRKNRPSHPAAHRAEQLELT